MDVGGGFPGGEARRGVGWLFEDSETTTHGAPDDGVVVEFDGDVLRLRDLSLMSHTDRDEVWGNIDPKARRAFIHGVAVRRGLLRGDGTSYSPLHLLAHFDKCWWTSPPPVLSSPSSSLGSCRRGDFLLLFSVDCGIAVGESDKVLSLLCREDDPGLLWWRTRSTSCLQDSFEHMKYFGPVRGLGVALAVLDEAHAERTSCAVSVARADGVSKRTGHLGCSLAVVPSAGAGTHIWEVRAACAAATHL